MMKIKKPVGDGKFRRGVFADSRAMAEKKARMINEKGETFFALLTDISRYEGDTCGGCSGFQCVGCWRGAVVMYALGNKEYFEWLHKNREALGVNDILNGISSVSTQE